MASERATRWAEEISGIGLDCRPESDERSYTEAIAEYIDLAISEATEPLVEAIHGSIDYLVGATLVTFHTGNAKIIERAKLVNRWKDKGHDSGTILPRK
jgi:hypothetical protein